MLAEYSGLKFTYTNESLPPIMAGLDVGPRDNVLAIAGSGDQAFAILENASKVTAIDSSSQQIEYIIRRVDHLADGRNDLFLSCGVMGTRRSSSERFLKTREEYFDESRLDRIRAKLNCLELKCGDLFGYALANTGHNKIYFSNAFTYSGLLFNSLFDRKKILGNVAENLPMEGLIYFADGNSLSKHPDSIPENLELDCKLSKAAQSVSRFTFKNPSVYHRI